MAALAAAASPAGAQSPACGKVVTQDFTLDRDLLDCPGNGLVIGAPGITIDLNGHTIAGRFAGDNCGADCLGENGIDNSGAHDRVVVRNGTISSFDRAIHLAGARRNVLAGLTIVAGGPIGYTRVGIFMSRSHNNRVLDTSVTGGGPSILLSASDRNRIGDTTLHGGISQHQGDGVHVTEGSERNLLVRNGIDAAGIALVVHEAHRNLVAGNALDTGLSPTLTLSGSNRNEIRANTISTDGPAWAIRVDGNRNLIGENTVTDAYLGDIEVLGALNWIRANDLTGSGVQGDGIAVLPSARSTLIDRNRVSGASDDGIDVHAAGTRLRQNVASGNGDLGIVAVAGVSDLGGNRASGNGNPLQCVNVFCTP